MRHLSLIKTFLVMKYKVLLEYKAAFWVASFSQILHYSTELLLLWVLVMRFQNLGGWTADEIVLLSGGRVTRQGPGEEMVDYLLASGDAGRSCVKGEAAFQ